MGNIFAASEILEIAVQIEKNGYDFYSAMAFGSKDTRARELFTFLSKEEDKHRQVFLKIMDETEKYEPQGLDVDQYSAYMNSLAADVVFTQKDKGRELAAKIKSQSEAIDVGIKAEKDSIVFYEGIKKAVPGYDQKIVDEIIEQEQGHLKLLMELSKGDTRR